jgi:MPBQ/MSBQ methyltransferase
MSTEAKVAGHYTRGGLEDLILQSLKKAGKDPAHLAAADLAAVDEFHVGGLEATQALATQMELRLGLRFLDVGSGIGGPARYFAAEHGCKVTGIDLTEEFVRVATSLTRLVKLDHLADFRQASALELPFERESFDRAYMIHVGMNIPDKAAVYREVRRVLKLGGLFAIFDIVRTGDGPLQFPLPWSAMEETSFVVDLPGYRAALQEAGFRIDRERDRLGFAIEFTENMMARMAQSGPPVMGLYLLMGEKTPLLVKNVLTMMKSGVISPVEIFARAA